MQKAQEALSLAEANKQWQLFHDNDCARRYGELRESLGGIYKLLWGGMGSIVVLLITALAVVLFYMLTTSKHG